MRTWFVKGVADETGFPWMPTTVWDAALPERSCPAVKLLELPQDPQVGAVPEPDVCKHWMPVEAAVSSIPPLVSFI